MKFVLVFSFFLTLGFTDNSAEAKVIQVPEECLETAEVPCLVHVKDFPERNFQVSDIRIHTTEETIMKWTSFENKSQVELIKGNIKLARLKKPIEPKHVESKHEVSKDHEEKDHGSEGEHKESHAMVREEKREAVSAVKKVDNRPKLFVVNGVEVNASSLVAIKSKEGLQLLNLQNFLLSSYAQASSGPNYVLEKTEFQDKDDFVQMVAVFFKTRNQLISFLKTIEKPWKKQLQAQSAQQTKVLQRAIASVELEKQLKEAQNNEEKKKLKKVRELFFYRTFYR